jgi:TonB family protein
MREPRFYLSASCSLFFHILFLSVIVLLINSNSSTKVEKSYIVSIVSDLSAPAPEPSLPAPEKAVIGSTIKPPVKETAKREPQKREDPINNRAVEDRISELMAKKRIERLVAVRNTIDLSSSARSKTSGKADSAPLQSGHGKGDYLSMVRTKIMERWVYPETIDRDLEAIISIKIKRDGSIQIMGIEKSSGNRLFDRSALSAISSIASLPPPPEGLDEVGIRFKP